MLELSGEFKEPYSIGTLQLWYPLTDMHFILPHVEFEDELSISILKNKATCYKNLQLEIEKSQMRPFLSLLVFFKFLCT
jgi:hypothetical protein